MKSRVYIGCLLGVVMVAALSLTACPQPSPTPSPTPKPVPSPTLSPSPTPAPTTKPTSSPAGLLPALAMAAPRDGATLPSGDIIVSVVASNFSLVDKPSQPIAAGEGHIHYFLDVTAPTEPGKPAVTVAGTYASTAATSHIWKNVGPGQHTLSAELVNNNHTPLEPPVVAKVTITVSGPASTPSPTLSPSPTPSGQAVTVALTAQGFAFDKSTLTVPAGASVTMNLTNGDAGVPHNFALYDGPALGKSFFVGRLVTGPAMATYTFTAPTVPGTYFFRCDVHPSMSGSFVVT